MELNELVNVVAAADTELKCPFPHFSEEWPINKIPPPETVNDADKLSNARKGDTDRRTELTLDPPIDLGGGKESNVAGFSAHHLIPGNEIWNDKGHPLHAWAAEKAKGSHVKGDIGYDTNCAGNGLDLPSNKAIDGWSGQNPAVQLEYALAAMAVDHGKRQFHDSHKAYSEFVWNVLEKVAAKIANQAGQPCPEKRKNCGGEGEEKWDPPLGLVGRLHNVATRLKVHLRGEPTTWQAPVMTSRFAMMFAETGLSQAEAREKLREARKKMKEMRGTHG